ncbi:MAG: DUF5361 domain-containing protein [Clostridiales bacterium]|nr:DUF5361 domain-containing protein [Clostridiales bacterium]
MLASDRDALACDLAETYGIYDMRALPVSTLATLAAGLREDSRIKLKLSGARVGPDTLLLAAIADRLSLLVWSRTEDAQKGCNRPASIVDALTGKQQHQDRDVMVFDSPEAFEAAWAAQIGGEQHGN